MEELKICKITLLKIIFFACIIFLFFDSSAKSFGDSKRGEYIAKVGGCYSCHTDEKNNGKPYAGGRKLVTEFGIFRSPNITPDKDAGIGHWTDDDFVRAFRRGIAPDGRHYFPVFPYPSYTLISKRDLLDLKAFLFTLDPYPVSAPKHNIHRLFNWSGLRYFWKFLFFEEGPYQTTPSETKEWNRGKYLVDGLAHCGECHTPRNVLGAMKKTKFLSGTLRGPNGEKVSNITSDMLTGIGGWTKSDIITLLATGVKPDFDNVQGSMDEAIQHGLVYLTEKDLAAISVYLKTVKPIHNEIH